MAQKPQLPGLGLLFLWVSLTYVIKLFSCNLSYISLLTRTPKEPSRVEEKTPPLYPVMLKQVSQHTG